MLTSLTFYGGVGEIGSNKILLEDEDTQLLLDFGMSFKQSSKFFSEFLQPRKCNCIEDFIVTDLLPDLEGIYRLDYLRYLGRPEEERRIDAVLLSHAHTDHSAYIHHLRKDIPIYCSPASKAILQVLEDTGSSTFSDLLHHTESFAIRPKKRGEGFTRIKGEEAKTSRPVQTFESGCSFYIGPIQVTPYEVDHSLPGASAFLIHTSQGTILYTGDLRFHGYKQDKTEKMVEAAATEDIAACITEGTHIEDTTGETEEDVLREAGRTVLETDKLVAVNFPPRDLARLTTFHNICKNNNRKLALSFKHAYLLELMAQLGEDYPRLDDPNICFYAERKDWGLIGRDDYPPEIIAQDYYKWERRYLDLPNTVNYKEVRENQRDYMLYCNYFQLKNLIDIRPSPGSNYIRSVCEPFDDEMLFDLNRVNNWLDLFSLSLIKIHASGHANGPQLFNMLERVAPISIYPIHTNSPEIFDQKFDNVVLVKKGVKYQLN